MNWPNRVWELGDVDGNGKQLWWSREATRADHLRRKKENEEYIARQLKREGS